MLYNHCVRFPVLQSSRGQDINLLIVDEANFLRKVCYDGLLPHAHKVNAKLIFASSSAAPPPDKQAVDSTTGCDLNSLRSVHGILFSNVTYVCSNKDHLDDFLLHPHKTTCECFVHYVPSHVKNTEADRSVSDKLSSATGRDVGYLLDRGVPRAVLVKRGLDQEEMPLIVDSARTTMLNRTVDTSKLCGTERMARDLFVYVDTCAHLPTTSMFGIAVCCKVMREGGGFDTVLLGSDHCHPARVNINSPQDRKCAFEFVPSLILDLLRNVCELHTANASACRSRAHFQRAFVAIECNSYELSETCRLLELQLSAERRNLDSAIGGLSLFNLYHTCRIKDNGSEAVLVENSITGYKGPVDVKPGFVMGKWKVSQCDEVFALINNGKVSLSNFFTTVYLPTDDGSRSLQDLCVSHMCMMRKITSGRNTKVSGKTRQQKDDMAISIIMAIYLANKNVDCLYSTNRNVRYVWREIK